MKISDYQGLNALKVLKTENEREVYRANWDQLNMNYDGHVEWQRLKHQILYCEETKEYLYAKPGPVKYVPGTRPVLEKEVAEAIKGCTTDREKVLGLLVFCRDLLPRLFSPVTLLQLHPLPSVLFSPSFSVRILVRA